MKKTILLALSALTLAGGAVVGIKLAGNQAAVETFAYDEGTVYYCLTGEFDGVEHWTDYVDAPSDGTNAAVLLNQSLKAGDLFKFKVKGSWNNALTFNSFHSGAGAYNAFCYQNGKDNVYCAVTGTYNFYIWNDNGNMKISAEFADSNTASYSYVMTSNSTLSYTYLYTGSQKLREWASSPSVNGQAYDIKFTYNEYDYYGLYRIDDRILSGWQTLIMKNNDGSAQSADITRTKNNKQELYLCGASVVTKTVSSDEYKAMDFLYDLVTNRGAANYDGHDFAYSVCATPADKAAALASKYDGFSADIKTILAGAKLKTYDMDKEYGEEDANKAYVDVVNLVNAMKIIVAKDNGGGAGRALGGVEATADTMVVTTVALASTAAVALGVYAYLRKKKEQQ